MSQEEGLGLPEHVVSKIEKVLGVSSAQLNGYDLVKLIEELCDTALMFDAQEKAAAATPAAPRHTRYVPQRPAGGPGPRKF